MPSPVRHCIAPHCPAPYPQPEQHRFCQRCGSPLVLQNRYIPRSRLGTGGFATIYTVWDQQTQQEQVLKVLTLEGEQALQLFTQEARVLRQLPHPGIPQVGADSFFAVQTPTQVVHCLVMEKIQGDTLEMVLERDYPQGCPETLVRTWLIQVLEILVLLHRRGIIHRDIKPANLMRRSHTGQIVLIDFGGAKQLNQQQHSTRLFSTGYSPPEQVVGQAVQPTVDLYALGRTMIHLLTGRYPGEIPETAAGRLDWQTPTLQISSDLAQLLNGMIAPDARDRPPTAQAAKQLLGLQTTAWPQYRQQWQQISSRFKPTWSKPPAIAPIVSTLQAALVQNPAVSNLQTALVQGQQQIQPTFKTVGQGLHRTVRYTLTTVGMTAGKMIWSGAGAIAGTIIGAIIQRSPWGQAAITAYLNPAIAQLLPGVSLELSPVIWLITLAGAGTAWGLAVQSAHLTDRPPWLVGLLGGVSYSLGWVLWFHSPGGMALRLGVWLVVAVGGVVLSLGIRRSLLEYLGTTLLGTGTMFWSLLTAAQLWPHLGAMLMLEDAILTYGFCGIVAIVLALWLGISHHVLIPLARWIRKRTVR